MVNKKNYSLSQVATEKIISALQERIPWLHYYPRDKNKKSVSQMDLFGNVDGNISVGTEMEYRMQNKSRDTGHSDICFECRSYRGKLVDPDSGDKIPVEGMYWYEPGERWLFPRFGNLDTISVYITDGEVVGHFSRYYLDIMFTRKEIWQKATGFYKESNDTDTYLVFFNFDNFCEIYIQLVAEITCGDNIITITKRELEKAKEELLQLTY